MKLSDLNPHIRYASLHQRHTSRSMDSICYDCRLFYFMEGRGSVVADGEKYGFSQESALYFPPGTRYHFYPDREAGSFSMIVLNFDLINRYSHLGESLSTAQENDFDPARVLSYDMPEEFSTVLVKKAPELAEMLHSCTDEFLEQGNLYREAASALLKRCLIELIRKGELSGEAHKLQPVIDYIHLNYHDAALTNELLAERFNYHPYYLSQMMKKHTGQSLHQYLISYRLKISKRMLVTTDDAINEVAWKSGFASTSHFIKMFREQFGMTPRSYRKAHMRFLY